MNGYYLGFTGQLNKPSYPILFLHFISGTAAQRFVAHFVIDNGGVTFGQEYCHIKAFTGDINERKENRQITQGEYE